ncbi:PEP-CTERM sorting domain-containing protein [Aquisediminimonas sediminicola]|uniref:PEP-CTERM sorting domain-containing protein n=1 Tax=Alteraquisediminimonas sediminicola TaxID=2676787 RepID=UPI001C8E9C54|nr:PEP-CTERM sorting domain-containing protein [Aquisediminimonas sediminicola]
MKKVIFAMGAALAAVIGVSPASATIYTYTRTDGIKLVIDTVARTGTFSGSAPGLNPDIRDVNLFFAASGLNNFNGSLTTTFTTQLGHFEGSLTNQSGQVFTPNTVAGAIFLTINPTGGVINIIKNNGSWTNNSGAYTSMLLGALTSVVEPTAVPEPAMLGLFGAGAVMVMMGRRRRPLGKHFAGKAQGSPRLAMA